MTFITGSVTNANPGPTLYALIETAMLADGWTLADTVVIGGNTHKVLKSAAAGNVQALDWYLDINYPTTGITGGIRFCPFEGYNATTHVATRGPAVTTSTTVDATTYSPYGASSFALETNWVNSTTYSSMATALTTATFDYYISVTRNRIAVMVTNVPSSVAYAGFFTPTAAHASWAGSALFPLVMWVGIPSSAWGTFLSSGSSSPSVTGCSLTRIPKMGTLGATYGWYQNCYVSQGGSGPAAVEGQVGVGVDGISGRTTVSPLDIFANTVTGNSSTPLPGCGRIGTVDDVAFGAIVSGAVRGSTITIGSDTWYAAPLGTSAFFIRGI